MNSQGNQTNSLEDEKESSVSSAANQPLAAGVAAGPTSNDQTQHVLPGQILASNPYFGYPGVFNTSSLQLLQRGQLGNVNPRALSGLGGMQGADLNSAFQAQAFRRHQETELMEARLRFLQQQQQNQDLMSSLRSSSVFPFPAAAGINPQLAMRGLGGLTMGESGLFPQYAAVNLSAPTLHVTQSSTTPFSQPSAASSAAISENLSSNTGSAEAVDDKPEMEDGEYFNLFGFNDEGQQVINETFPHKLYRMLYETEKKGQQDIVSFFPHGKAFAVHKPRAFVTDVMPK